MELRWYEVNREKRLQYLDEYKSWDFKDVPTVKEEKKVWCPHILWESSKSFPNEFRWWLNLVLNGNKIPIGSDWKYCPKCSAPRPKE